MRDAQNQATAQDSGAAAPMEQQSQAGQAAQAGQTVSAGQPPAGRAGQKGLADDAGHGTEAAATSGHDTLLKAGANPEAEAAKADGEFQAQRERLEADYKKQWAQTVTQWKKQAQDDPEIGGGNLPATVARAQLALNRFDPDGTLGGWLAESGYGNHPEVLRFFNRIAEAMAEDGVVQGRGTSERLPLEERMYGHWSP